MLIMNGTDNELSLDERKAALISLLKRIMTVLDKNGLKYFAYYGTLLGAVRHQGFIPWDDDIDLGMMRKDYDNLIKIDWEKEGLRLISPQTREMSPFSFTKITDHEHVLEEDISIDNFSMGLNIDIFPIDSLSEKSLLVCERLVYLLEKLRTVKVIRISQKRSLPKNTIIFLLKITAAFFSFKFLTVNIDRLSRNIGREELFCGCKCGPYGFREFIEKQNFADLKYQDFEELIIPVPSGFDVILEAIYGDFMELPPEEKRITHHRNKVYRKVLNF